MICLFITWRLLQSCDLYFHTFSATRWWWHVPSEELQHSRCQTGVHDRWCKYTLVFSTINVDLSMAINMIYRINDININKQTHIMYFACTIIESITTRIISGLNFQYIKSFKMSILLYHDCLVITKPTKLCIILSQQIWVPNSVLEVIFFHFEYQNNAM